MSTAERVSLAFTGSPSPESSLHIGHGSRCIGSGGRGRESRSRMETLMVPLGGPEYRFSKGDGG